MLDYIIENIAAISLVAYYIIGVLIAKFFFDDDYDSRYMHPVTHQRKIGLLAFVWPVIVLYAAWVMLFPKKK